MSQPEQKPLLGLLGRKVGMSQMLTNKKATPVTLLQVGPCPVVQVKTQGHDGYDAIQIGFDEIPERKASKADLGNFKKANVKPLRHRREIRMRAPVKMEAGHLLTVEMFSPLDYVTVTGTSKGSGFSGVMHKGSHGGPGGHGSMFHRRPGSIGSNTFKSNTPRGRVMPGRLGSETITLPRVEVVGVEKEQHLLVVKGAVPGKNGTVVMVLQTGKKKVVQAAKPKIEKKAGQAKTANRSK